MTKYYIAHERGRYWEANADNLTDLRVWIVRKFGELKPFTDNRRDDLISGRRFAGLSEIPVGFGGAQ